MELRHHLEALQADLAEIAGVGNEEIAEAGRRLSAALRSAIGLRLLDALAEAALEVSDQLPAGHVEVRLAGQDPSLVYVEEEPGATTQAGDEGMTARISLRLPESLKEAVETAAAREGISVNAWLVRALARAVGAPSTSGRGPGKRMTGFTQT